MSESKFETLSSLVDDSLSSIDLSKDAKPIDCILKDEELAQSWQNYHLIGDVLRDEMPQSLQLDLSSQIAEAIANEATILSPNSASVTAVADELSDNVAQEAPQVIQAQNRFTAKVKEFIKPAGQIAIAASAAVLMVVGVQQNVADDAAVTPNQIVQPMPLGGYANPVSFNYLSPTQAEQNSIAEKKALASTTQSAGELTHQQKVEQRIAQQRRLQALINDHEQQVKLSSAIK
ncbi:sigma-E factor negative regulatory protein RseA [Colwellia asteriadis]|uniref:Anti-sigma-E factor RseA n=1 Tax=Colwellia asteriadis TaxID=517723 RepID=A0ABP3WKH7_9GAMM